MRLVVERRWWARHSHQLPPGVESRLHWHWWLVRVHIEGPLVEPFGWVMDLDELDGIVRDTTRHRDLRAFVRNPTAERVAARIGLEVGDRVGPTVSCCRVELRERPRKWAVWTARRAS